jgi:hypothetical protein
MYRIFLVKTVREEEGMVQCIARTPLNIFPGVSVIWAWPDVITRKPVQLIEVKKTKTHPSVGMFFRV